MGLVRGENPRACSQPKKAKPANDNVSIAKLSKVTSGA